MQSVQVRQILFLIILLLAFILIFGILIYSSTAAASEINSSMLGKKKLLHYKQDTISIDQDEVIEADIIIETGTLSVFGEVYGDIIAFDANVELEPEAEIYGHVICYKGLLEKDEAAKVAGDIVLLDENSIEMAGGRNLIGYGFLLTQYQSDTVIAATETISRDILVLNHELVIEGKVDGDVINILGRTVVKESGAIDGHVITYNSQIAIANESLVTGRVLAMGDEPDPTKIDKDRERDERLRRKVERKYLKRHEKRNSDIFRFWGDVTIEPDEIIRGDVVTVRGTIQVKGEVKGDIVAVFGNVDLDSTAYCDGDVVSVGGKIYREVGAFVSGDLVQTSFTGVKVDDGDQHVNVGLGGISVGPKKGNEWAKRRKATRHRWGYDFSEETFMVRYNRVEGLFLGLRLTKDEWDSEAIFDLFGHIGYGFAGTRACYQIGIQRPILGRYGPIIGIETHDETVTEDEWFMPTFENSLAAFFIKEDFHDFYRQQGYSAYAIMHISEYLKVAGEYHDEEHFNLKKHTNWSIFGGDKKFRANPAIPELNYKSVVARASFDTRDNHKYPDKGWFFTGFGEFARNDFNDNEVDFDRFILDLRRFQPVSYGENLDFRIRVGSTCGAVPEHLRFDAGGFSALRGYEFKEFTDQNRMVLGTIEYRIYGSSNPLNNVFGMSDFNFIVFGDAGYLWSVDDSLKAWKGFDSVDWDDLKTSIGFAISNDEGNVRLNFAKRLDEKNKPIVVTFRISRPF